MVDLSDVAELGKLTALLDTIRELATNPGRILVGRLLTQRDAEDMDRIATLANKLIGRCMAEFDRIAAEAGGGE